MTKGLKRAFLHTPSIKCSEEEVAKEWLRREKERKISRDLRKINWECPICGELVTNASYKITNGRNKGKTLKQKHVADCAEIERKLEDEVKSDISSTEERVKRGEVKRELEKKRRVRRCPYSGCNKEYKNNSGESFRSHLKNCTFKNQKELGGWVIKNSRKFDYDMLEN